MGTRDRAPSGPLTRVLAVVRGALGLVARSAFALVRVFLAGCALLAVLMVPVWLWAHVVIDALDIKTVDDLTQGEQLTKLLLLLAVPTVAVLGVVALSLYGGATVVLDDVATGRRPRAVRSLLRGLASAPRLLVSVVPAVVVMAALAIAAPAVTLVGLVLALVTSLGRRVRPSARWPSRRTLVVLIVPFGAAALCATRWSIVPSVVVLERAGVRAAYRRAASLSRGHLGELALSFALLTVGGVALWRLAGAVLSLTDASLTAHDALAILIEGFVLLLVAAIAVRLFVEAGGVSEELSEPMPPRVHVSMVVLFALVAGLAPMVSGVRPAGASVAGATIVVNDLGDASDALPGDGVCATASGTCTLRAAITESNTSIDEVIGFNVSGTITVASQLTITAPVVIDGAAAGGKVVVSGGGTSRVFFVQIDGIPGGGHGTIRNLTVAGGREATTGGAAVYNSSAAAGFVLENMTIRDNTVPAGALFGGAVANFSALTIRNSTFVNNSGNATVGGSDVANRFAGTAAILNSTFTGSTGSSAVESTGASLDVRNSIVTGQGFACSTSGTITGAGNVTTDSPAICPGATATAAALGLTALADNGGPTPTVRITDASAAIGAGEAASCPAKDQRGAARPGPGCDAGAYEFDQSTTTTLSSTPNPSAVGGDVELDATVSANVEPGTPTGSVEFFDGATPLGTSPLVAGGASLTVSTLTAGSHTLKATYHPNAGFATSTSSGVPHNVNRLGTTTSLTSSGSPTLGGDPVTFTINVTSTGPVPTGTVDLLDGTTTLTTLTLDGSGKATYTTSSLSGGHHDLTASYGGDASHTGSTSAVLGHNVVDPSTTSLSGPAGPTVYGTGAAFTVTVTPGGTATPTGQVTLSEGASTVGSATLDGSGQAVITVSTLLPGPHSVTAGYAGDSRNAPSTSTAVSHTVTAASTATGLGVSPAGSSVYGTQVTLQATVTSSTSPATPAGSAEFFDGAASLGTVGLDPSGVGTLQLSSLGPGSHNLRADYSPAAGFTASSSSTVAHTVNAASTNTGLAASSATSTFGEPVTLTATVDSPDSPSTPTGTVTFRDGTTVLGTTAVDGAGVASLTTGAIATGSRTLTAQYNGAAGFTGSTSAGLAQTVNPATVKVTASDTPDPSVFGTTVVIDVTVAAVAPGAGVPTGSVVIREGATTLATVTLDGSGHASANLDGLTVGAHTLTADYLGDGSYAAGSTSTGHNVGADTATLDLVSSSTNVEYTDPVTFTATVTGTGGATPTGTVTFHIGATVLGVVALNGAAVAKLTLSTLPYGTSVVVADYSGDAGFGTATDHVNQTVNATETAVDLSVSPPAPTVTDLITLTATVVGTSTSVVPVGSVTFFDGTTALGTAPVDGSGQATWSQRFDRTVHSLTARFTGTPGWSSSTSPVESVTPGRALTALSVSGAPSAPMVGGSVTWTASIPVVSAVPAPTGPVTFWSGTTPLGTSPLSGGSASIIVPAPTALGAWTVYATYAGDLSYEPATSPDASVVVTAAGTATTPVVPATSYVTDPIVLRAFVSSIYTGAPIGGTVRFTADSPGFSPLTAPVDVTGFAQVTATGVPAGNWVVTATFEPAVGSVFALSTGSAPTQVTKRPSAVTLHAPLSVTAGVGFDVSFSVTDTTSSGPSPTGTVTVSGGGGSCTGTVAAGRCTLTLATAGSVPLVAVYSGDANYLPSTSASVVVTAARGTSVLTASSPTATWVTGDPITVVWRLTGPIAGEVVVRSPFGEVCRSTVLVLGSCTVTFPFAQRGQTIPLDVTYAGSPDWSPASAVVTRTLVGCYQLSLAVVPAGAGAISGPSGSCNAGTGFFGGTPVSVVIQPNQGYVFDHWLEDGSTLRTRSYAVGEGSQSATAIMRADCVDVRFTTAEQVDLGTLRSLGGHVDVSPPNCPGRTDVERDPASGGATAWFLRGSEVTLTGKANRPQMDELKGWLVEGSLTRTREPLRLQATRSLQVEGRFGVQCASLRFASPGGGTASPFTPANCIDEDGFSWQKTTRVGAHVLPDAYHWIDSFSIPPVETTTFPHRWPDTQTDVQEMDAYWVLNDDLRVDVSFETCSKLTFQNVGPGTVEAVTPPDCRTRAGSEGPYYDPKTLVELRAVPDAPSTRVTQERGENVTNQVVPAFLRWSGLEIEARRNLADPNSVTAQGKYADEEGRYDPSTGGIDPVRALVDMADDRTMGAVFYDEGRCMPFINEVKPAGAATLDVTLTDLGGNAIPGGCPQGEADLGEARIATFRATPTSRYPRVGWEVTTTDDDTDETVHLRFDTTGSQSPVQVKVKNKTTATAYVCMDIQPKITLIAPDGSEVTGPAPPGSDFVQTDAAPDCPLWENAFQVGQKIRVAPGAPAVGYEFNYWAGDVQGASWEPVQEVDIDGSHPTIVAYAGYKVRCVTVTLNPGAPNEHIPEHSPKPNCPGAASTGAANEFRYIGGTPVMLDARAIDDYNFTSWTGEGLLDREQMIDAFQRVGLEDLVALTEAMDHPAMITADFDMTVTANYTHDSLSQRIGDDLAVAAKKAVGVLAGLVKGALEGTLFAVVRLGISAVQFLTKLIDPGATGVLSGLARSQAMLDLPTLSLICAGEWAKGQQPTGPDIGAFDNNTVEPLLQNKGDAKSVLSLGKSGVKLNEAITNYRQAHMDPTLAADYLQKIPTTSSITKTTTTNFITKTEAVVDVTWAGIGAAAALGDAIYSFVSDGPGIVWEDTAKQAWETGGDEYEACIMRHLSAVWPESIPNPDTGTAMPANASGPAE